VKKKKKSVLKTKKHRQKGVRKPAVGWSAEKIRQQKVGREEKVKTAEEGIEHRPGGGLYRSVRIEASQLKKGRTFHRGSRQH